MDERRVKEIWWRDQKNKKESSQPLRHLNRRTQLRQKTGNKVKSWCRKLNGGKFSDREKEKPRQLNE
jgi:hypothetical protein